MNIKTILLMLFCMSFMHCDMENNNNKPDVSKITEPQSTQPESQKSIEETIKELSSHVGKEGVQGITKSIVDGQEVIAIYYAKSRGTDQPSVPEELNGYKIICKPTQVFKAH